MTSAPTLSGGTFTAAYDGDGLRITKTISTATPTTTYYLYDGGTPIVEETWNGTQASLLNVNGWAADGWRARLESGVVYDFMYDPQGSLVERQSSGAYNTGYGAYDQAIYEGYGALRQDVKLSASTTGGITTSPRDPVGFGGQYGYYTDLETGLLCLTHRYYDPGTGKFINRDPIGYAGGANLYGFADGNPVNEIDPNGTSKFGDAASVVGLTPGPIGMAANLASGVDSALEGDWVGAGLSVAAELPGVGELADAAKIARTANRLRKAKKAIEAAKEAEEIVASSSRAARRRAMRRTGIPTSQQPVSQINQRGARQYLYSKPRNGGGDQEYVVTQHQADNEHPLPHWEAGRAKDPTQVDPLGRRSYFGGKGTPQQKVKVEYK